MNSSVYTNLYEVLGVGRQATSSDIRDAYRKLALERHPDKNLGNPHAVAAFQKLQEAYETLSDEDKRRQYDAKCCFPLQGFGSTKREAQSRQESNDEAAEKSRVEKRDREWLAQAQSRASNIVRLRQDITVLEADLKELQRKENERQAQEDSDRGLFGYLSSFWSAKPAKTEVEKEKDKLEQIRQRTSSSIRLQRAKTQLQQAEQDDHDMLREQFRVKNEEALREQRARAQKEQEARSRRAREQEEAARAREAAFKNSQDEARQRQQTEDRRRQEQQENERRERDLRQELLDRLAKQHAQGSKPGQNQTRFTSSAAPKTANSNTSRQKRRSTQHAPSAGAQTELCLHKKFWPKFEGRHKCSVCHRTFHIFVLQCPDCNVMACAPCRKSLRVQ